MGRFSLAWRVLTSGEFAARIAGLLNQPPALAAPPTTTREPPKPAAPTKPLRSEAVTLLATLQREARLIDFLKEPIDGYSDAQVGAAVRDIHRDCCAVMERQFAIRPVLDQEEGSQVSLGAGTSAGRIKRTGRVADASPVGTLVHPGWQIGKCELPVWTGAADAATVIAPAEVEMR